MQHRGMEIVDRALLLDDAVAIVVGRSHDRAAPYAAPCHPERKPLGMVVAAVGPLCEGRAAKLTAPYDQRRIEEAAGTQVADEGRDRLVDGAGVVLVPLLQIAMLVPTVAATLRTGQLDKPHPPLHHPPRKQALRPKHPHLFIVRFQAVGTFRSGGLLRQIEELRHLRLHAVGQLLIHYRAFNRVRGPRGAGLLIGKIAVERLGKVELGPLVGH